MQAKLLFHVEGIRCHSCVQKIETALHKDERIGSVHVRMDNSLLEVACNEYIEPRFIQVSLKKLDFQPSS